MKFLAIILLLVLIFCKSHEMGENDSEDEGSFGSDTISIGGEDHDYESDSDSLGSEEAINHDNDSDMQVDDVVEKPIEDCIQPLQLHDRLGDHEWLESLPTRNLEEKAAEAGTLNYIIFSKHEKRN
ncbi:unnamed protein product [Gordionus sp. m RMFG-2023]